MKNTLFSPAFQRFVASNPNCFVQFSRGYRGSLGESALDIAHQTAVTTPRKQPNSLVLRRALHFKQNTKNWSIRFSIGLAGYRKLGRRFHPRPRIVRADPRPETSLVRFRGVTGSNNCSRWMFLLSTRLGHRFAVRNVHRCCRVTTILRHANGGIWTVVRSDRSCTQVFPVLIVLNMV